MMASQSGHVEVVDKLLQHGAGLDLQKKVLLKFPFQLSLHMDLLRTLCVYIFISQSVYQADQIQECMYIICSEHTNI